MTKLHDLMAELSALDPERVEAALGGLSGMGVECLKPVMDRLSAERDAVARVNLLRAVGRVAYDNEYFDPDLLDGLRTLKEDGVIAGERGGERRCHELATYVKVLGMCGDSGCFDEIRSFFEHPDSRVRANAVEGAAFIMKRWSCPGDVELQQSLEELLKDDNVRVSVNAAVGLYLLHSTAASRLEERVRSLSSSKDAAVRAAARRAAASFGLKTSGFLDIFSTDSIFALLSPDVPTGG